MADYMMTSDPNFYVRTADGATVPRGQPTGSSNDLEAWLSIKTNIPDPMPVIIPVDESAIAQPLLDKLALSTGLSTKQIIAALKAALAS